MNATIVVNKHILGGSQYVNNQTGALFSDENDIVEALESVLKRYNNHEMDPRGWY